MMKRGRWHVNCLRAKPERKSREEIHEVCRATEVVFVRENYGSSNTYAHSGGSTCTRRDFSWP
jgi:hypothetical protein